MYACMYTLMSGGHVCMYVFCTCYGNQYVAQGSVFDASGLVVRVALDAVDEGGVELGLDLRQG